MSRTGRNYPAAASVRRLVFTVYAMAGFLAATIPSIAQPKAEVMPQSAPAPKVVCIGHAERTVKADTAVLSFGVEIRDPSTSNAVMIEQRATKRVVDALQKSGVAAADIVVAPYEMEHVVDTFLPALGTNQPVEFQIQQKGTYKVTSQITVTTRSIAGVQSIVDTAVSAGVDRIGKIEYRSSRRGEIERALVADALADARSRAESLARSAGLTLGAPLEIGTLPASGGSDLLGAAGSSDALLTIRSSVRVVFSATKATG